ncbi:MAG: TIGR01777 family oxidoreductase, partial [Chloroflexus sp.]
PAEQGPWFAAINGAWGVVHLAGAPISSGLLGKRWTPEYKAEILNSRVIGTRGIVNAMAAAQQRPAVFVCASAVGYYGFYRNNTPLDERAPAGRDFLAQVCVAWEAEAAKAEALGVRTVMLRTGLVLDPDSGALPQLMLPFKLLTGGPILPGTQVYPWIHPADEVGLIRFALENERVRGPLNAAAPNALANRDFAAVLGKVLGSPSWLPVPEFSLRLALGEMADLVVNGQNAVPRKALDLGYQFRFPTLEPALRDLLNMPH